FLAGPRAMIRFRDFVPKQLHAPHFGLSTSSLQGEYETLESALAAANEWRQREGIRVLNLETVVLPNMWAGWEQGSTDPVLGPASGAPLWYQFIRIWYEE